MSLLIDLQYFGNLNYYKKIVKSKHVIFEQYMHHEKRSFSNRSSISGSNGVITLSVPLEKGRSQKTLCRDVKISNAENWQLRHFRSIVSSYNNSPWFKFFYDDMAVLFSGRFEFLMDWDLACFEWTRKTLKADWEYRLTEPGENINPTLEDWRNKISPRGGYPESRIRYAQVFEDRFGFIPDLSILDLLFCEGPKNAMALLTEEI